MPDRIMISADDEQVSILQDADEVIVNVEAGDGINVIVSEIGERGPKGDPGAAASMVIGEIPIGDIDGMNAIFTPRNLFVPESLEIFYNGQRLSVINDYNLSGGSAHMLFSPEIDSTLLFNYSKP